VSAQEEPSGPEAPVEEPTDPVEAPTPTETERTDPAPVEEPTDPAPVEEPTDAAPVEETETTAPPADPDDDLVTEDIVVTGTRTEERAGESAVRVEVIDRPAIEASGARDAGELLEEFPGVYVDHTFRGDSISIRGLDPEYVLILVDGDR